VKTPGTLARATALPHFALIAGFLAVDFLFFHDIFKAGEVTTLPQYMTGFLSILVFTICSRSLLRPGRH
jgi:hypothetical protein